MSTATRTAAAPSRPGSFHDEVNAELVRQLYRQATLAVLAGIMPGGYLLAYILWSIVERSQMLYWLAAHTGVCLLRLVLVAMYFRRPPPPSDAMRWALASAAVSFVNGCVWALACVLFFDPAQPLSVVTISVILFALSGGSAAMQGAYLLSFWAFTGPMLGVLVMVPLWHGGTVNNWIAFIAALTAFVYFAGARNVKQLHTENVALRREAEEKAGLLEATLRDMRQGQAALEAARASAEHANAAKTRFLAAASHDLRQPIHVLGLLLATLTDRARNERTAPLLEQMHDAVEAVDSMLSSLLDISKLDAGVVQPKIGPVDVGALLQRLCNEQQPIAELTGNRLRVRPSSALVRSDVSMLHRIIVNLVSNALRYTNNGRVLVGVRSRRESVRIDVLDTGPGIPADSLEEIFVEFHQLGNPERDRRRGLGLGLAIVKRLAGLLGSPIEVRSVVGRGSRFSITVPRTMERQRGRRSSGAEPSVAADLQGRCVLVLDDEVSVLEAMRPLLERWGCEVITAASPEEAEARLASGTVLPDLLIVDYRLRRHASGIETIGRLRDLAGKTIPALVITGDTAPDRLREAQESGHPLLHKPVMPGHLRAAMRRLMARDEPAQDEAATSGNNR